MKPSVYIETSVIGHLTSRLPRDIIVAGQMLETRRWWDQSRQMFDLFISELVQIEISQGDPIAAAERLAVISGIPELPVLPNTRKLAGELVQHHGLPMKASADAVHVASCAINRLDYLLTWNCRHLANASKQKSISDICRAAGYNAPIICTPQQLKEFYP